MPERKPDAIQREIEETRAELAATLDAIAERVSPRRAAGRGAARVKTALHVSPNGQHPAPQSAGGPSREQLAIAATVAFALLVALVVLVRGRRS